MIILKEFDSKLWQYRLGIDPITEEYSEEYGEFLEDTEGNLISEEECICFAKEPTECMCACSSWENYDYD